LTKKAKNEPFKDKDVKVDLESLGLDEIDAKDGKKPVAESSKVPEPLVKNSVNEKKPEEKKEEKSSSDSSIANKISEQTGGALSKIQNFLSKTSPQKDDDKTKKLKANSGLAKTEKKDKYINSQKKLNLKKLLTAKKKAAENEKKHKAKLAKLNKLREKYLIKIDQEQSNQIENFDDDLVEGDEKIIPQRKNINKFSLYETPPPPILDRYRSSDNVGIPIVFTKAEKVDILFRSIGREDISYFNSAYSDLENPDLRNYAGDTILTYSLLLQKRDVAASILAKGANPNLLNGLGYTALQIAIETLDLASFDLLVNSNADINYVDGFGRTYLMHAARVGFLPAIETLIKKGVNINALDFDGFSALEIANRYKQDLSVALLLKNGAKPWVEKPYDPNSESIIKQLENRWKK